MPACSCRSTTTTSWPAWLSHQAVAVPMMPLPNTAIFISYLPRCPASRADGDAHVFRAFPSGRVCRGCEGVRVELVFWQAANAGEVTLGVFHHDGCTTGVDLMTGKIGNVIDDRAMHKAAAALPIVVRGRLGDNRDVLEVGQDGFPSVRHVIHIKIHGTAPAPVEAHWPRAAIGNQLLDHGLDGCEARTAGQEDDRLVALTQEERPQRRFHARDLADRPLRFAGSEHVVGEHAARCVPDVQLYEIA